MSVQPEHSTDEDRHPVELGDLECSGDAVGGPKRIYVGNLPFSATDDEARVTDLGGGDVGGGAGKADLVDRLADSTEAAIAKRTGISYPTL
jgi:hypothetical protein